MRLDISKRDRIRSLDPGGWINLSADVFRADLSQCIAEGHFELLIPNPDDIYIFRPANMPMEIHGVTADDDEGNAMSPKNFEERDIQAALAKKPRLLAS